MAASFAPKVLGLAFLALIGTILTASASAESLTLSRKSSLPTDRGDAGVDSLASLGLRTLDASPAAAAALRLVVDAVIPSSDQPHPDHGPVSRAPGNASSRPHNPSAAKLPAVPEPTAIVLGLTSTLVLGSLSWKRRLTHPPRD